MPLGELGMRMSAYELCVIWPAFYAERERLAAMERAKQDK